MAVRTQEQVEEQGQRNVTHEPKPEDVVRKAVEEGRERTENADSAAPDKGMTTALGVQDDMQAGNIVLPDLDKTEEALRQSEQLKNMSLEDLVER